MNYVVQLLFSILRTISQNYQFNSSTEGSISKFLFQIACSASCSTDVDALKFRLVQYDKFYSGEQQEDASEENDTTSHGRDNLQISSTKCAFIKCMFLPHRLMSLHQGYFPNVIDHTQ